MSSPTLTPASPFLYPIQYSEECRELDAQIIRELELIETHSEDVQPIYTHIYNSTHITDSVVKYYTTDVDYLTTTQELISNLAPTDKDDSISTESDLIEDVNNDSFCLNHDFLRRIWNDDTIPALKDCHVHINAHTFAQTILNAVKLFAILLSIGTTFVTLTSIGGQMYRSWAHMHTWSDCITYIMHIFIQQSVARFGRELPIPLWILAIVSVGLILFTMYQNVTVLTDYRQMQLNSVESIRRIYNHMTQAISEWRAFYTTIGAMQTPISNAYQLFIANMTPFIQCGMELVGEIDDLQLDCIHIHQYPLHALKTMGRAKALLYQLHANARFVECRRHLSGFHTYWRELTTLARNITNKHLHPVTFDNIEDSQANTITCTGLYYPAFISTHSDSDSDSGASDASDESDACITNNLSIDNNWIITGPNASGKTTLMKSLFINIILSQQIGYACATSMQFRPVAHFHSYLNIPDTSDRDSLFQAEARRGKEIIDHILEFPEERHLCIFDELFSGTNPNDAVQCGTRVMKYLATFPHATCLLTTHFIDICTQLSKEDMVTCMQMETRTTPEVHNPEPTFHVIPGISDIHAGLQILQDMGYPSEILS